MKETKKGGTCFILRYFKFVPAVIFFALIGGGLLYGEIAPEKGYSSYENRFLQKKPEFSWDDFEKGTYSKKYEEYVSDQFAFRNSFIALKTRVELLEGKNEIRNVFVSKDGYLIEDKKAEVFHSEQSKNNIAYLSAFINKIEKLSHKPTTSVMLIPTSSEILAEKLPAYAPVVNQTAVLKEIQTNFKKSQWIDMKQVLYPKKEEYVYYRTDHHWTSLGAYYGYEAWMKQNEQTPKPIDSWIREEVSKNFYGTIHSKVNLNVRPDTITLFRQENDKVIVDYNMGEQTTGSMYKMDMLEGKDQYGVFFGGNYAMIKVQTNVKNNKSVLLIKDSFANSFIPFLTAHYETIYMIDLRSYKGNVSNFIEENKIDQVTVLYELSNFLSDKNIFYLAN